MAIQNIPKLGPSEDVPRIKNRPRKPRQTKKPSELLAERQAKDRENMTLSERLMEANEALPPGEGMVGKAIKAGFAGAAAGATLGEALAKMYQERAQAGTPSKPTTVSGMAMTDTDLRDAQYFNNQTSGKKSGQQKRYTRQLRERQGENYIQPRNV